MSYNFRGKGLYQSYITLYEVESLFTANTSVNLSLEHDEKRRFIAPGILCVSTNQLHNNNTT